MNPGITLNIPPFFFMVFKNISFKKDTPYFCNFENELIKHTPILWFWKRVNKTAPFPGILEMSQKKLFKKLCSELRPPDPPKMRTERRLRRAFEAFIKGTSPDIWIIFLLFWIKNHKYAYFRDIVRKTIESSKFWSWLTTLLYMRGILGRSSIVELAVVQ